MKKTLLISLLLALLLFAGGCARETPTPACEASPPPETSLEPRDDEYVFTRDNFPRMDGGTSLVPLARGAASVLLGEPMDSVSDLVQFSRTTPAYKNLMNGSCDIVIAVEPSAAIFQQYSDNAFEYERQVIALDGLAFVVNVANPLDSLTTEQIQKIYTGEFTNWKQLGGSDTPIIAFQRNAESGSQTAMVNSAMAGLELMEPPLQYVIGEMGELMEAVRSFDGAEGAIGYNMFYYATEMKMAEGLKILRVNDVEPTTDTISSGAYPFNTPIYATIAKSAGETSPARILYDWFGGDDGRELVRRMGYSPAGVK